jgi:hypothetical protein
MLLLVLRESVDATLDAELRGLEVPVVLHLLSICVGRAPLVGVVREGTALSLRFMSTCSMVGRTFVGRLLSRARDWAGELYSSEGFTPDEVCEGVGWRDGTLWLGTAAAEAGRECTCCTAKLFIAGVLKPIV